MELRAPGQMDNRAGDSRTGGHWGQQNRGTLRGARALRAGDTKARAEWRWGTPALVPVGQAGLGEAGGAGGVRSALCPDPLPSPGSEAVGREKGWGLAGEPRVLADGCPPGSFVPPRGIPSCWAAGRAGSAVGAQHPGLDESSPHALAWGCCEAADGRTNAGAGTAEGAVAG